MRLLRWIAKLIITLLVIATILIAAVFILFNWPVKDKNDQMRLGVSFSSIYAQDIGLDWKETYLAILDDLLVEKIRLAAYWNKIDEPFLPFFGKCPPGSIDSQLVDQEIAQLKKLDSSRPIMVTDSGELSLWHQAAKRSDVFGTTLYRIIYKPPIGYFKYPLGPNFFRIKALFIKLLAHQKNVIISELQAEPWGPKWITEMLIEEQYKSMNPEKLKEIVEYARKTGFPEAYLWGAEWWYWLKVKHQDDRMWETAKEIINSNQ